MQLTAAELCTSTNQYSRTNIIGRGGFGIVHRGTVRGTLDVAIKTLNQVRVIVPTIIYSCHTQTGRNALLKTKPETMLENEIKTLTRWTSVNYTQYKLYYHPNTSVQIPTPQHSVPVWILSEAPFRVYAKWLPFQMLTRVNGQ